MADLEAEEYGSDTGLWIHGLLIRRNRVDVTTWCPAGTSLETMIVVAGQR